MRSSGGWPTLRDAWQEALYGVDGFYRRALPSEHFRTSVHASPLFAAALVGWARQHGLTTVTDIGSGAGELLAQIHRIAPDLLLTGVDLRPRPRGLPDAVDWRHDVSGELSGLVLANELLDDIPCAVVEVDDVGAVRTVEIEPSSGAERLGALATAADTAWCDRWWPVRQPGERAEVGLEREDFWADICGRTTTGICVAIDYGHTRATRPGGGSFAAYRDGRAVPAVADGSCDLTAHVAVDALAARVGAQLERQRDVLPRLGVSARRPGLELAATDPAGYVRELAKAGEAAELTGSPGLGDFWWVVTRVGSSGP